MAKLKEKLRKKPSGDGKQMPGLWEPWMEELLVRLDLKGGGHDDQFLKGVCLLECISYLTGQRKGAEPVCVAPAYRDWGIDINDAAPTDELRQKLKRLIPDMMGTRPLRKKDGQPQTGRAAEKKLERQKEALQEALPPLRDAFKGATSQEEKEQAWTKWLNAYARVLRQVG